MIAPEACRTLPLKSASVMELSMVTGLLLYLSSPLKVNSTNALHDGMDGAKCWRNKCTGSIFTYWHLGRKAAIMIAPEAPSCLPPRSAWVMPAFMVTACSWPKVIVSNAPLLARGMARGR